MRKKVDAVVALLGGALMLPSHERWLTVGGSAEVAEPNYLGCYY